MNNKLNLMGRYAFFNTGLEYKFKFGVQSSGDMIKFNGNSYYGSNEDSLVHTWEKKIDESLIKKQLEDYNYNNIKIDLTNFENNIEGTYKLKNYLDKLEEICNNHEYILGYLIYHQLQYVDILSVEFEL
jgi:hypothetical protein